MNNDTSKILNNNNELSNISNKQLLQKIIDDKYNELGFETICKDDIFWKSRFLKATQ